MRGGPTHPELSPAANERIEVARVLEIKDADWNQGPAHVNAKIKAIIERERGRDEQERVDHEPVDETIADSESAQETYTQLPGPFQFAWNGRAIYAEAVTSAPDDLDLAQQMQNELNRLAKRLVSQLDSQFSDAELTEDLELLLETLNGPVDQLEIGVLRMRYSTIRGYADVAAIGEDGRPMALASRLTAFADQVLDFMSCFEQLRVLEANRLAFSIQSEDIDTIEGDLRTIEATAEASSIVDPSAVASIHYGRSDVDELGDKIETAGSEAARAEYWKSRADLVSIRLLNARNFVSNALKRCGQEVGEISAESYKAAKQGIPKGVGKGVEGLTEAGTKIAAAYLVAQLAGPIAGIGLFLLSFKPFARDSQRIKGKVDETPEEFTEDSEASGENED